MSWVEYPAAPRKAVYEYKGKCRPPRPQGRVTAGNPGNYIRMLPGKMAKMEEALGTKRLAEVYNLDDWLEGARNIRQVYNAKARNKAANRPAGTHSNNFADKIDQVEQMQHTSKFIQQVIKRANRIPFIIPYRADQISDLCRICCPPPPAKSAVVGVDKTFSLGPVHATVTACKNLSIKNRQTRDHPIFIGPIFHHGDNDADTLLFFLQHLAGILSSTGSPPTFGSDEENAMRNAIARAFPTSGRLVCTLHAKKNLNANLANKVGLAQKYRKVIVDSVFLPNGALMSETDHVSLSDMMSHITD